jgi:sugar fermentation stimulation protein A
VIVDWTTPSMRFEPPLIAATLVRRYKRFLADVRLSTGEVLTVHCPNTGGMLGCQQPGMAVWLSRSDNPKRKYAHTWELVEARPDVLVGINTARTNALVHEALSSGVISELTGYDHVRREVRCGDSRLDFELSARGRRRCLVEVKNVTAAVEDGVALFPDAVSVRASRHVRELQQSVGQDRAVLLFCVQREDVHIVEPAVAIDPDYARTLAQAMQRGVEVLAWGCQVAPQGIDVCRPVDVRLPAGIA